QLLLVDVGRLAGPAAKQHAARMRRHVAQYWSSNAETSCKEKDSSYLRRCSALARGGPRLHDFSRTFQDQIGEKCPFASLPLIRTKASGGDPVRKRQLGQLSDGYF